MIDYEKMESEHFHVIFDAKSYDEAKKYYDRIYFDSTEDRTYMELWLESKGYIDVFNNKNFKDVAFKLNSGFNSDWKYPYIDSFKYISIYRRCSS